MPHGESWFSVLLCTFYKNVEHAAQVWFGLPVVDSQGNPVMNEHGEQLHVSYYAHQSIDVQHVFGAVFVLLLIIGLALHARARIKNTEDAIIPEDKLTFRTFVELLVSSTYKQMSDMMGPKAAKFFLPLIGTCAFFILFSNALGLVPGFLPPTDNLNLTLAMGGVIFFSTHIFGVKEHGLAYFKHFFGPIWWLAPLMLPIEIISHVVRPVSLAIRLMANMTADHLVLTIFIGLVPFVVPVPMYMLGVIVVTVQTLVFCLLSTVYISMAIAHEEH